ncbi:probably inactive leucine-rich repeat receptor-like protein kinase IMK2 [Bidens hawaiensis]|uniref:probably inactive leucine-rich repeat receptor-like protein kinase IMK2 n=1 Tax=Bidens hawaiensis TaxID=980011 RepID=UPI00404A748F
MTHGNLTSGNVLLDRDYNLFIIDIGLSWLRINARPDSGYNRAPGLLYFKNASMETDVYSLGLIIFELLTRKSTNSEKHGSNMLNWVRSLPKEQWSEELFDAEIMYAAINNAELLCILQLAMNCTCASPEDRPKVDEVLQRLEEISATRKGLIRRRNARKSKEKEINVEKRNMKNNKEP